MICSISDEGSSKESQDQAPDVDADAAACPSIIIYMIDPFSYTHNQWPEFSRLAMMGLLRCYQELIANLPEHMQSYVHPQVWQKNCILYDTNSCSLIEWNSNVIFIQT